MPCQMNKNMLYLYVSGELDEDTKKEFEKHLKKCEQCRNDVLGYQKIIKNYKLLPPVEKILSSSSPLLNRARGKNILHGRFRINIRIWVPAAAAIMLAFLYISHSYFFPKNPINIFDMPSFQSIQNSKSEFKLVSDILDHNDNLTQIQTLFSELNIPLEEVSFTFESDEQIQSLQNEIHDLKNEPIF